MRKQTRNKLKLDNKAIDKIKVEDLDFSYINKAGETKFKKIIQIPFDVPHKSIMQGLLLSIQKNGSKHFWLRFWFNSKPDYWTIGKYTEEFGVKEVEDKLYPIIRSHKNDKGYWIKNPKETEANDKVKQDRVIETEKYVEQSRKTINEVIIELMKANMPKIKAEGTLCAKSIREQSRFLIGQNKKGTWTSYYNQ